MSNQYYPCFQNHTRGYLGDGPQYSVLDLFKNGKQFVRCDIQLNRSSLGTFVESRGASLPQIVADIDFLIYLVRDNHCDKSNSARVAIN